MSAPTAWAVAIFAAREDPTTLRRTLDAVLAATAGQEVAIDVVVNGNPLLAEGLASSTEALPLAAGSELRIWSLALGDKAHAWNRYVHDIARTSARYFFVDGYVRPAVDSFGSLNRVLDGAADAWAASGVPTVGRSAPGVRRELLQHGGLHGNLHVLSRHAMDVFQRQAIELPLGLYRTDSLIGAIINFSADPRHHEWNTARIAIAPGATWSNDVLGPFEVRSWTTHFKRMQRQAQGDLENAAVRQFLAREKRPPSALPATSADLVTAWIEQHREASTALLRHPLRRAAARRLATSRDWSIAAEPPFLVRHASGKPVDGALASSAR